jgi:hypothetical protein
MTAARVVVLSVVGATVARVPYAVPSLLKCRPCRRAGCARCDGWADGGDPCLCPCRDGVPFGVVTGAEPGEVLPLTLW